MFVEEKSNRNDVENEGESADDSSHSASEPAAEIRKVFGDVEPTMNTMECLDLSKEKDSCSLLLKYVEGSFPQGSKADFLPLICDVERSHPLVTDNSCLTVPIVEQEDGSSHALESSEQSHPLEVVKPDGSSRSPLDPALEIEEQGTEAGLCASVNEVEQSHPSFADETNTTLSSEEQGDGSSPTSESWEQPQPLEVVKPWDDVPNSILGPKAPSNYSQPMLASDLDLANINVLDPSEECLDSRSMSKTVELSSYSNGRDSAVEKDHAERTECLSGMETVTPAVDNVHGSSPSAEPSSSSNEGDSAVEKKSPERTQCLPGMETVTPALDSDQGSSTSTTKECLVSDVHNSDEANRSDKHSLCTIENKEGGQLEVLSNLNILSGKGHCSRNNLDESSDPKSGLKGRNTQNDVPKASVSAGKNMVCSQVSQMEDANSEALPSKNVSPCRARKNSFKKQPNRHTQRRTKHQTTKLIMKDRNADPAWLKSCRPSKQLDHTCSGASSELSSKAKEINDANDAEARCSSSARTFENAMPMKRRRLILLHNEDDEAIQVEDSNPPSSENDGQVRMNRRHVESDAMNQLRSAEIHEEVLCSGNSNNQHANNHTQTKKQRRANKDKKAPLGNPSVRCAPNESAHLASEAAVAEGHFSLSRMPVFSVPTEQKRFICPQPIDKHCWTGIMKIGQEYISLAAHLSNQALKKVQELSRSLPPVMKVTKHSKLKAWPKKFLEASEPTAESIDLYFFSDNMRPNKDLDRLVQYATDHSIVLKYVVSFAKLLIFPSALLPEQYQMFQGKHYLWGVFRSRPGRSKAATQVKQKVSSVSKSHSAEKKDHQDKVQTDTQNQEIPVSRGTTPGAVHDIGTEPDDGDHREPQANSESEAPPTTLSGLFDAQAPRSEQYIKQLENEGAVVFPVKSLVKPGPVKL